MLDKFSDLDVDVITGTQIMRVVDITPDELSDPYTFQKFRDVMKYLKDMPDKEYFISKATVGKEDKLSNLWSYVELHKQRDIAKQKLTTLQSDLAVYKEKESVKKLSELEKAMIMDKLNEKESITKSISQLSEQIGFYER